MVCECLIGLAEFRRGQLQLCHTLRQISVDLLPVRDQDFICLAVLHREITVERIDRLKPGCLHDKIILDIDRRPG